ncbi:hypothetical protein AgCh_023925 [Apium graveolens]
MLIFLDLEQLEVDYVLFNDHLQVSSTIVTPAVDVTVLESSSDPEKTEVQQKNSRKTKPEKAWSPSKQIRTEKKIERKRIGAEAAMDIKHTNVFNVPMPK